jgi:CRP-like cAMP-binding protein
VSRTKEPVSGRARSGRALTDAQNHLIKALPRTDRLSLLSVCEPVRLVLAEVLCEPRAPTRYVYFPIDGCISLVARIEDHAGLEVGMVGREGMLGAQLMLGVERAPLRALVQGAGVAWRVGVRDFRRELTRSMPLRRRVNRYIDVLMMQIAASAVCVRFHLIGPRLARWLLMSHDRTRSDGFRVTHEFLSYMLGVRRVGVTTAAQELQRRGLIEYHRGELKVLDRRGLEAAACSCYAFDHDAYAELIA